MQAKKDHQMAQNDGRPEMHPAWRELLQRVTDQRSARGLTVRYLSPFDGTERRYTARDHTDRADFCRRVAAQGGWILDSEN